MALVTGQDLIEAGWPEDANLDELLAEAAELEQRGIQSQKYVLKLLDRKFPKPDPRLTPRESPLAYGEAIEAVTEADEQNLGAVRRYMADLMRCPVIEGGAIMPDACPAGNAPGNIPVGGAIAARNAILPGAHGSDICCSMYATFFECDAETAEMMDHLVDSTRFGPGGRHPEDRVHHDVIDEPVWDNRFLAGLRDHAAAHMADQGDGNHFAFLGRIQIEDQALDQIAAAGYDELAAPLRNRQFPEKTCYAVVTHHGSRGLGAHLYKRGLAAAIKQTERIARDIPDLTSWLSLESEEGAAYWEALQYVGRWTRANHESIHQRFLERANATRLTAFGNEHNFVWKRGDLFLHGKGATPAWNDDEGRPHLGLIPLNMAKPILLVLGRDNTDYLSFAPHGAGRNISRRALMRQFRQKDGGFDTASMNQQLERSIAGLDVRWYLGKSDYSECPLGYKPPEQVKEQIERFELADIVAEIEPLGSIMAGNAPRRDEEILTPKQKRQIQHRSDRRKQRQQLRSSDWENEEA